MKNIIREIKDCHSVHINCCACGAREKVYFIPESIILKLEVGVAETETTTKENLAVGNYLAQTIAWGGAARAEPPEPIGNAAAIREALENSNGLLEELALLGEWGESARAQIAENKAALSEPLRNCDVGTEGEQSRRFDKFCYAHKTYEHGCEDCPLLKSVCCELAWAQMPYEEGGAE